VTHSTLLPWSSPGQSEKYQDANVGQLVNIPKFKPSTCLIHVETYMAAYTGNRSHHAMLGLTALYSGYATTAYKIGTFGMLGKFVRETKQWLLSCIVELHNIFVNNIKRT